MVPFTVESTTWPHTPKPLHSVDCAWRYMYQSKSLVGMYPQDFMDRYLAAVENYQQLLEALRIADAEDYHILKIRCEEVWRQSVCVKLPNITTELSSHVPPWPRCHVGRGTWRPGEQALLRPPSACVGPFCRIWANPLLQPTGHPYPTHRCCIYPRACSVACLRHIAYAHKLETSIQRLSSASRPCPLVKPQPLTHMLEMDIQNGSCIWRPCAHAHRMHLLLLAKPPPLTHRLETDIQNLEQHLEAMRATYQLNTEKLEYNYRVLKVRRQMACSTMQTTGLIQNTVPWKPPLLEWGLPPGRHVSSGVKVRKRCWGSCMSREGPRAATECTRIMSCPACLHPLTMVHRSARRRTVSPLRARRRSCRGSGTSCRRSSSGTRRPTGGEDPGLLLVATWSCTRSMGASKLP